MSADEQQISDNVAEKERKGRRSGEKLLDFAVQRPFTGFVAILIVFSLTFFLVWGLINGGFPQPSELGL